MIFLVTIHDKALYGEPDIALAVVDAPDESSALRAADNTIDELAANGRGRCVPHARPLAPGKFYRLGAVVRLPPPDRDGDLVEVSFRELSDIVNALGVLTGDQARKGRCLIAPRLAALRTRLAQILASRPTEESPC